MASSQAEAELYNSMLVPPERKKQWQAARERVDAFDNPVYWHSDFSGITGNTISLNGLSCTLTSNVTPAKAFNASELLNKS